MSDGARIIVRFGTLEALAETLQSAHDDLVEQVEDLLTRADAEMGDWSAATTSRAAQRAYRQQVVDGVDDLVAALDTVRTTLAEVATMAHEAEVRNVAALD